MNQMATLKTLFHTQRNILHKQLFVTSNVWSTHVEHVQCVSVSVIITLICLNNFLFYSHFQLRHKSGADATAVFVVAGSLMAICAFARPAAGAATGDFGGQSAGHRGHGPHTLARPGAGWRRRRQDRSAGWRRLGSGAAVATRVIIVIEESSSVRVALSKRWPEGPVPLLFGPPAYDATCWRDPIGFCVAKEHNRGDHNCHQNHNRNDADRQAQSFQWIVPALHEKGSHGPFETILQKNKEKKCCK